MKPYTNAIERAFELATSGRYLYLSEIRERLRYEGYFTEAITGSLLCNQLKDAILTTLRKQHKPLPQSVEREGVLIPTGDIAPSPAGHRAATRSRARGTHPI